MKTMSKKVAAAAAVVFLSVSAQLTHAAGMLPESTAILIDEANGEAAMNVKNTDPAPTLLYSTIQAVPEDKNPPLVLTPPVARVEPDKTQLVRFMLTNTEPLKVERYARVTFDGIPEKKPDDKAKVTLTIRQSLPVVIHPKSLAVDKAPWKHLKWYRDGDKLMAFNDSPYVVRMDQQVLLQPGNVLAGVGKAYLIPGERVQAEIAKKDGQVTASLDALTSVVISPFTAYGYASDPYTMPIGTQPQASTSDVAEK
ncbi:fimbria/pilus chaperone family protein [Trinickia sp. YCB016]